MRQSDSSTMLGLILIATVVCYGGFFLYLLF